MNQKKKKMEEIMSVKVYDIDSNNGVYYFGNNIDALYLVKDESVDLVYTDPPFNSKRVFYYRTSKKSQAVAYDDKNWEEVKESPIGNILSGMPKSTEGMIKYLNELYPVVLACYNKLTPTGTMYLHCDTHSVHYLKIMMDNIFGIENYINDIVLKRYAKHNDAKGLFGRYHDNILLYKKGAGNTFNAVYEPYTEEQKKRYRYVDKNGRYYSLDNIANTSYVKNSNLYFEWNGYWPKSSQAWMHPKEKLDELYANGEIEISSRGIPRRKIYLDERKGMLVQDWWDDLGRITQNEFTGYPTQKRLKVLERIIKASSNAGDTVLDPFLGSGTTAIVAEQMGRSWIGMDNSDSAFDVFVERLKKECDNQTLIFNEEVEKDGS